MSRGTFAGLLLIIMVCGAVVGYCTATLVQGMP